MQVKPRPYRLPGLLGSRNTNHESRDTAFSRNTASKSVRSAVVAHGAHRREPPVGASNPPLNQCFPALCFQFFAANCCAQVQMRGEGMCTCPRTVNRCEWASRRAPFAGKSCESPQNPVCPRKMLEAQRSPPSGPLPLEPTTMNPCRKRGTLSIAMTVRSRLIDTSSIAVIPLRFSFRASARRCLFEQASGLAQDGRRQEA